MTGEVRAIAPLYTDLIYSGFEELPGPGEEVYTKAFDLQLGGGAAAIPVMLSRTGVPARLGTFLGDDAISRLAISLLEENGLKQYENLYRGVGRPVVVSSVFSYGGDRSFLSFGDEITQADLTDAACYDFLEGAAIAFAPQGRPEVVKRLHEDGTILLYDIGWTPGMQLSDYADILQYVDYFTPNEKEARQLTGEEKLEDALQKLGEAVKTPVVKCGAKGCIALHKGEILRVPAVDCFTPVDFTGAGDNFMAGLLYGVYQGWPLVRCLQMGNVFGGYSTTQLGCYKAGLTLPQAMDFLRYYGTAVEKPGLEVFR